MVSKRQPEILKALEEEGTITIAALARRLGVSLETVRRDIRPLAETGAISRVHGAVGLAHQLGEAPFERRMRQNADAKRRIARAAARTIRNGESVMLDTGTTTSFLARELLGHRDLTIVTNSSDIARTLATVNGNKVYMAGGELRSDSGAAFGATAIGFIRQFRVVHAVISAGAADADGIMDFELEEAELARAMLECASHCMAVTDQSKFGRTGLVRVCGWEEIGELVSDGEPPADIAAALSSAGTALSVAEV
jgi:DeoR family glycerol-3-phosphate regulon repressor